MNMILTRRDINFEIDVLDAKLNVVMTASHLVIFPFHQTRVVRVVIGPNISL